MSVDRDLPDPSPRVYASTEEHLRHRWKMGFALFCAAVAYSTVHKLFVPLVLSRTNVLVSQYAQIDYGFIPAWILLVWLWRRNTLERVGSALSGLLIVYAAWEAKNILQGHYVGWLVLSHFLSSIPVGLGALYLMTFSGRGRILWAAWVSAGFTLAVLLAVPEQFETSAPMGTIASQHHADERLLELKPASCGVGAFEVLSSNILGTLSGGEIGVSACGFSPQALWADADTATLRSQLTQMLNVHVTFYTEKGKKLRHINRILPSGQALSLESIAPRDDEAMGLIFSDSSRSGGVVLLLSPRLKGRAGRVRVYSDRRVEWIPMGAP
jgi:hypothetical protein